MDHPVVVAAIVLAAVGVVWFVYIWQVSGGDLGRYFRAKGIARRWLRDPDFAAKVHEILHPRPPEPPKPNAEPVRLLTLLQREGRLLDFLLEDIQGYGNDQIGAAVRDIHRNCQKAVKEHLVLEPVLDREEGAEVEVAAGFDPSAIRLTGNVTGQPPFKGRLQHHGWRVKEIKLGPAPEGQDLFVVQPAEVELP